MVNASVRYGVSLRKRFNAISKEKKTRYMCDVCGKEAVRRVSTGIWKCRHCGATYAGGAYSLKTSAGDALARLLAR